MKTDILVIGGGIVGTGVARHLAKAGAGVTLVERHEINSQASGANSGSLHAQIPWEPFALNGESWGRAFAPTVRLMKRSIAMWRELEAELGTDLDVATPGGILVARGSAQMRIIERKAALERANGLEVELLDQDSLRRLAPYVADSMIGGAYCATEGKANPLVAGLVIGRAAAALGARIELGTSVEGITREAGGFRVTTSRGEIRAGQVIDCAGAEAGRIAAMVGLALPIEAHAIQTSVTERVAPFIKHLIYSSDEKLSLKQTRAGTLLIGGGWPAEIGPDGRAIVRIDSLASNMAVAVDAVPAIGALSIVRSWAAIVNGTADWRPILGAVPGVPGFIIAFFPWMGFTAGPFVARAIADVALGRPPELDIAEFAPSG